ncbi:hypothetical protein BGX38DRAFT_1327767 [Terfezia claveryi]|nr:hypothetical protein BGX38DRAFT_1327767 [Terfezia claveryi]
MTEVLSASSQFEEHYRPTHTPRGRRSSHPSSSPTPASSIPRSYQQPTKRFDSHSTYSSSYNRQGNTIVTRVPVPQANRGQFLFGDYDEDEDEDLDFPVYDYAETITPNASPDLEPSLSLYNSESYTSVSEGTISPPNSPDPEQPLYIAFDDNTIRHEPSRHVDYLSHNWKEEDIWSSWRYMIGKRNVYQNSARLENASWRTWAKAKYGLKTLPPERLNWLKDCDVTWLYGPLSTGEDKLSQYASPTSPSMDQPIQSLNALVHTSKKPILKKRSMSEVMLQRSLSTSSLLKQAAAAIQSQQSESQKISRPSLNSRANSDFTTYPFQYVRESEVNTNELPSALSTGTHSPSYSRHIHFNNRVEQCIAVDKGDDEDFGYDIGVDDDSDSSDDGLVMMASSRCSARSTPRGSFSEHQTIAMLPSTTLKPMDEPESIKQEPLGNGFVSFLSSSFGSSITGPSNATSSTSSTLSPATIVQSNFLVDDDDDLDDYAWQPSGAFANRRDSVAITRPKFSIEAKEGDGNAIESDSDEGESPAGLLGRAVDAVNTARDIAHVLWNVGWRK